MAKNLGAIKAIDKMIVVLTPLILNYNECRKFTAGTSYPLNDLNKYYEYLKVQKETLLKQ